MTNVFRELLGGDYGTLGRAVQDFHDHAHTHYQGTAFSGGAAHILAKTLRRIFGFPPLADDLTVDIWLSKSKGRDLWQRRFGDRRFQSSFHRNADGTLDEKFGPFRFAFRLRASEGRMYWDFERWSLLGLRLPNALGPRIETYEAETRDGAFEFYSHADFPLIGRLVHYHGTVRPAEAQTFIGP